MPYPFIIGHRGARGEMPENSLEGCLYLQSLGIHDVEIDAHVSRDGKILIHHDATLKRTTQGAGFLHKKKAATIQAFTIQNQTYPKWKYPTRIPILTDLLDQWPKLNSMQLELKKIPIHQLPVLALRLFEIKEAYPFSDNIIITSQFPYILGDLQKRKLPYRMGLINIPKETDHFAMAKALGCQYLISHYSLCEPSYLKKAHKKGFKVSTWTVNAFNTYHSLMQHKHLESIITDYPAVMMGWKKSIASVLS